jgi:hypothetical protein
MKRDMDLLRLLLLKAEEQPFTGAIPPIEIPGHTVEEVYYHALLAKDAGFVEASFCMGYEFFIERLTYSGHEFMDAAREDRLWNKAKETVLKNAGTLTVESLKVALSLIMQQAARGMIV